jgi:hypothetical protein
MPSFRIYRLCEQNRQQFRWAPHTIGATQVRPKDYEEGGLGEAEHAYALWASLKDTPEALRVGDLLETEGGEVRIYKYVGFEEARWVLPEVKTGLESAPLASGPPLEVVSSG